MLSWPSPKEIVCLRECLLPWLWEGMRALWLQAVGLSCRAGRSPDSCHSDSPVSDAASCFPFRHGLLPSQHWKGCLQSLCQGSPWRKTRKGRSSKRSADGSRGIGASLHGRVKLCATQRDGHHADLSGGTRDGMSNAGDFGSSVPAEGLEAAARARQTHHCSQQRCFGAIGSI